MSQANFILNALHKQIVSINKGIKLLTRLRETLLLKLVFGELRLPESMLDSETNPPAETAYE